MAKTIKAILCPTCGSNQKTELKPDYYICNSCKTEYYLDSDDINIIHTNKVPPQTIGQNKIKPAKIALIIGGFLLLFIALLLSPLLNSSATNNTVGNSEVYRNDLDDENMVLVSNKKNQLLFVTIGIESTGNYESRKEKLVAYFDDSTGKNIKKQEIAFSIPKNKASSPFTEKYFENGDCYLIFNDKTLFKVEPDALEIHEVKQDYFKAPEFANGIAKLEKQSTDDGFEVQTLDAKKYVFMPLINKVYEADKYSAAEAKVPAQAVNTTKFKLSGSTFEVSLLIKYVQMKQEGYPSEDIYFDTKEDSITVGYRNISYVSHQRFLPNRKFFHASILGYNSELLIISFTIDANSSSSQQVQALDVKTGAIRWTFDCGPLDKHVKYYPSKALSNKEITILDANFGGLVIDNETGKVLASIPGR